jgi:beta-galactosidase/beta-glucuronidase
MKTPRPEHPNPQFERDTWLNLNGEWQFQIDSECDGKEKGFLDKGLTDKITVPFCLESSLSGVGRTDFICACRYKRKFTLPTEFAGKRVFLRFGAVDYAAYLYINSRFIGAHKGGYSSFSFDITDALQGGENTLAVYAEDNIKNAGQPRGKQSDALHSYSCLYTRVTGIWQTVYLEAVPERYVKSVKYYPDPDNASVTVLAQTGGCGELEIEVAYQGRRVGYKKVTAAGAVCAEIPLSEKRLWEPGRGRLYDVKFSFCGDTVKSYFGLRSARFEGLRFLLNGKAVFQRLVLDQGYYPDGIYTAPDEESLIKDIELSIRLGFNGARLHQKAFEKRFLYHCDRLGYMVWGEYGCWGLDYTDVNSLAGILPEWSEIVERDFNHPSIITWCPFNETWMLAGKPRSAELIRAVYRATKTLDPTRPCVDTSGGFHTDETDVYDIHNYEQDGGVLENDTNKLFGDDARPEPVQKHFPNFAFDYQYGNQPVMISEYGGCKYNEDSQSWGYGEQPKSPSEFLKRYTDLTKSILSDGRVSGFCYTQLYDVEQEQNGLYTYARGRKFEEAVYAAIAECNRGLAAIEKNKPKKNKKEA